jgi:hypothetical protein
MLAPISSALTTRDLCVQIKAAAVVKPRQFSLSPARELPSPGRKQVACVRFEITKSTHSVAGARLELKYCIKMRTLSEQPGGESIVVYPFLSGAFLIKHDAALALLALRNLHFQQYASPPYALPRSNGAGKNPIWNTHNMDRHSQRTESGI